MSDRQDDTSKALTEIRTVRSRAMSARDALAQFDGKPEVRQHPAAMGEGGYEPPWSEEYRDPDADEMDALLAEFIEKTEKFAKRGTDRKTHHRPRRF